MLLVLLAGLAACSREEAALPSGIKYGYQLPQGNHSYDDTIVKFYKKYETFILYKFSLADFRYVLSRSIIDTAWQPAPEDVGPALNFMIKECMQLYPDPFLMQVLPNRILLAGRLDSIYNVKEESGAFHQEAKPFITAVGTDQMLAFGWANPQLLTKTPVALRQIRGELNALLFKRACDKGVLKYPDSLSLYQPYYGNVYPYNNLALGTLLTIPNGFWTDKIYCLKQDLYAFIAAITRYSEAEMEGNLLTGSVDVSGKLRKKRDIIIRFYEREYGVNLQAIGNRP